MQNENYDNGISSEERDQLNHDLNEGVVFIHKDELARWKDKLGTAEQERDQYKDENETWKENYRLAQDHIENLAGQIKSIRSQLSAANERLKAAEEQEPLAYRCASIHEGSGFEYGESKSQWIERYHQELTPLYARPIPAQPSPVAAVDLAEALAVFEKAACHQTYSLIDGVKAVAEYVLAAHRPVAAVPEPSEIQVYRWFQEATIAHHIQEDGEHIAKRAMFLAKKACEFAIQSHCVAAPRITEQDARENEGVSSWKLVPFNPTAEMLAAMNKAVSPRHQPGPQMHHAYRAALESSPLAAIPQLSAEEREAVWDSLYPDEERLPYRVESYASAIERALLNKLNEKHESESARKECPIDFDLKFFEEYKPENIKRRIAALFKPDSEGG